MSSPLDSGLLGAAAAPGDATRVDATRVACRPVDRPAVPHYRIAVRRAARAEAWRASCNRSRGYFALERARLHRARRGGRSDRGVPHAREVDRRAGGEDRPLREGGRAPGGRHPRLPRRYAGHSAKVAEAIRAAASSRTAATNGGGARGVRARAGRGRPPSPRPSRSARNTDIPPRRVLVTWVVQRDRARRRWIRSAPRPKRLITELPEVLGVSVNFHEGEAPQILGAETVLLAGAPSARDSLGDLRPMSRRPARSCRRTAGRPRACTGAHASRSVSRSRSRTTRRRSVSDLYAGSGAIALGLATAGANVHLVESFAPAVAHAKQAAEERKDLHVTSGVRRRSDGG